MPTLEAVYCKFGMTAEAAQLLETELGNLIIFRAIEYKLAEYLSDKRSAHKLFDNVNRMTLGKLLFELHVDRDSPDGFGDLLYQALSMRNRLSHSFYRDHNLRRNSDEGRSTMIEDLEAMHACILDAYKAVLLISGIDIKEVISRAPTQMDAGFEDPPMQHLPI